MYFLTMPISCCNPIKQQVKQQNILWPTESYFHSYSIHVYVSVKKCLPLSQHRQNSALSVHVDILSVDLDPHQEQTTYSLI